MLLTGSARDALALHQDRRGHRLKSSRNLPPAKPASVLHARLSPDGTSLAVRPHRWEGPTFQENCPPAGHWPMPHVAVTRDRCATLTAFDQFVVKLHSRCNLACDYCYVFELLDTGWRRRPRTMPAAVREQVAHRISEHVRRHRLSRIRVILHGGEPLLAGTAVIDEFAASMRRIVEATGARVELAVQTNGTLLTDAMLEVLLRHEISVGVSLDGDERAHDRHRGRRGVNDTVRQGSHAQVAAALARLDTPRHRRLFGGLLCTVDLANPPGATYDALVAHHPPAVDFLLPHGTWDAPPTGTGGTGAPYGDWLCEVFDLWERDGRPVRVRLFESVIGMCRDHTGSSAEALGTLPAAVAVVETDGALVWADSLNAVADGASHTGANIFSHSFDGVLALPDAPEHGVGSLCATCRSCALVEICGGGLRAHRYGRGQEFANPSVYCLDLTRLIQHISRRTAPMDQG
ncbi:MULTISPECIES: FxsB family cyclophane-forming radical SAM/SPASM peptide maturase [unclassified Streptomyces]|uniref:FxsB family cyclophane-forming radical SAM/SPASM peptide maturase n=2 Tax=unclassified Streptomyces TaxID=2593676 RepID=UPI002E29039C|nr:FxsB family cyclophane-forming radical SAM/SPASM peptide maturase [Streptomyces sp. NBC_00228]